MDNYFLKVNFILGYDNRKEILSYELYNNDELINIYTDENAREISRLIKDSNIKAKQEGFNYIIDDQKFIKKNFFKKPKRTIKKFSLKKAIIISSLAAGSILTLVALKKHKDNSNKEPIKIEQVTTEETNEIEDNNQDINEDDAKIEDVENVEFYFDSNNIDKSTYNLSYESRSNEDDINYVKENYYSSINANSNAYGNDPDLIAAIIAQENYNNSKNYSDVGGHGVMQIESIWNGYDITAYNFNINDYETVTIDTTRATDDIDYCIKVGCMIYNYQYNYIVDKYTNFSDEECFIASLYSYNKGLTIVDECLSRSYDFNDFLYQIKNTPYGDNEYSNHVLSYIPDETILHFKTINQGEKEITINNTLIDNEKEPSL